MISDEQWAWIIAILAVLGLGAVMVYVVGPQHRVELWLWFFKVKNNLLVLVMGIPGMLDSMLQSMGAGR
jgi:hypothetical protein